MTDDEKRDWLTRFYPADTPAEMMPAWLGSLSFAIGQEDMLAAFRAHTGMQWVPPRNGLDRMIDAATGNDGKVFVEAFIKWHNECVWGPLDGPVENGDAVDPKV